MNTVSMLKEKDNLNGCELPVNGHYKKRRFLPARPPWRPGGAERAPLTEKKGDVPSNVETWWKVRTFGHRGQAQGGVYAKDRNEGAGVLRKKTRYVQGKGTAGSWSNKIYAESTGLPGKRRGKTAEMENGKAALGIERTGGPKKAPGDWPSSELWIKEGSKQAAGGGGGNAKKGWGLSGPTPKRGYRRGGLCIFAGRPRKMQRKKTGKRVPANLGQKRRGLKNYKSYLPLKGGANVYLFPQRSRGA